MKKFWRSDVKLKDNKAGFIYLVAIFICFMVLAVAGLLLEITGQYQKSFVDKWTFFQKDLDLDGVLFKETRDTVLKDLQKSYQDFGGGGFSKTELVDGASVSFKVENWKENLGYLEVKKDSLEKRADIYLFYPEWLKKSPYLFEKNSSQEFLQAVENFKAEGWKEVPYEKIYIPPGHQVDLIYVGSQFCLMEEDQVFAQWTWMDPICLKNDGTIHLKTSLSLGGILINNGKLEGKGSLIGLYFSNQPGPLKVKGLVVGRGLVEESTYDIGTIFGIASKTPIFYHFQLKNLQSRPHNYF